MISFDAALAQLLATARSVGAERVPLERATGRVLAEDLTAAAPMPAFDYSAMDGYAVAASDFPGDGPFELPVRGESAAGGDLPLFEPRTACRIFTGAKLPRGADTIVMQEHTERIGDSITIRSKPAEGSWIRRRGEDLALGATALARGTRLGPGHVALAAGLDRATLLVARSPVVSILASGDELRAPGDPPREGSIVESNGIFIAAVARAAGAVTRILPHVRDDAESTRVAVAAALRGTDLLITIGGVSVGDRDYVRPALEAAGVALDFYKVAIKPGKPIVVGRAGVAHVLGLPGNPASASLTFLIFGVPLLRALQGDLAPVAPRMRLRVAGSMRRKTGRMEFVRARLDLARGVATISPNQSSGAVTSFAQADALIVVPEDRDRVDEGDELEVIRVADF